MLKLLYKTSKVGFYSALWLIFLLIIAVFANFIANEKPLYAKWQNKTYFPAANEILFQMGNYQWEPELIRADWKKLDCESTIWALVPFSPEQLDMSNSPASPPFSYLEINQKKYYHYLGTDEIGRDILSGIIYGARLSLFIGITASLVAGIFGTLVGGIAGFWNDDSLIVKRSTALGLLIGVPLAFFMTFYARSAILSEALITDISSTFFQFILSILIFFAISMLILLITVPLGKLPWFSKSIALPLDNIFVRILEIKLSIPLTLMIVIVSALVQPGILLLTALIAFGQWTTFARLVRAEMLKIRNWDFILICKSQGFSSAYVFFRHAIPNALPPIWVTISFAIAGSILVEASISFIGYGLNYVSWGNLLKSSRSDIYAWWLTIFPGFMIFATIFSLNSLSEAIRKILNPKES